LQKNGQSWQPVMYASRAMTTTECGYAQVEKEALAITWSCEKFSSYVLGKKFAIETDHKPLIPLLGNKSLHSLPPRILRFVFDWLVSTMSFLMSQANSLSLQTLYHLSHYHQWTHKPPCKKRMNTSWRHVLLPFQPVATVLKSFMPPRLQIVFA